jgi:hypothetical protein
VVEVWDSDKLGTDDYIGNVLVPVAAQREYKITGWFNLSRGAARPVLLVLRRLGSLLCVVIVFGTFVAAGKKYRCAGEIYLVGPRAGNFRLGGNLIPSRTVCLLVCVGG